MFDPIITKARLLVGKAIRSGELVRGDSCQLCGFGAGIVGHHWRGYEGDAATDVWWICESCNTRLRGCHDGRFTLTEAREFVRSGKKPEDKLCKGKNAQGERCQVILIDREYCNLHDPDTKKCKAIGSNGYRCNRPASKYSDEGYCTRHKRSLLG